MGICRGGQGGPGRFVALQKPNPIEKPELLQYGKVPKSGPEKRFLPCQTTQLVSISPQFDEVVNQREESCQRIDRRKEEDVSKLQKKWSMNDVTLIFDILCLVTFYVTILCSFSPLPQIEWQLRDTVWPTRKSCCTCFI